MVELLNIDCLEYMATCIDKQFDLAIVDPPYGIDVSNQTMGLGGGFTKHLKSKPYKTGNWDKNIPDKNYFFELFRISVNQIIWGGNYMIEYLKPSSCWVFWDKQNGTSDYADGELAWTSFKSPVRRFQYLWAGCFQKKMGKEKETRIHPTHKPVDLYKWLLKNYADPSMTIIDTHLGSGSSAIAAYDFGCDFVGCEIDKDYYDAAVKRFEIHKMQQKLF